VTGTATTVPTLTFSQGVILLALVVGGSLLTGVVIILGRGYRKTPDPSASIIRSWLAVSLVIGLLVFCGAAFLVNDMSLRSTLFGGLIASVGAAVAFYFSSKATDALTAAVAGGTQPSAFSQGPLPAGEVGVAYSTQLTANGQPPPTYQLVTGPSDTLPPGLTLETSGALHGTPQTAGTYTFKVAATNSAGTKLSDPLTIVVS